MTCDYQIYLLSKVIVFSSATYLTLSYVPIVQMSQRDIWIILIILAIVYIMIDNYFPNVYYQRD